MLQKVMTSAIGYGQTFAPQGEAGAPANLLTTATANVGSARPRVAQLSRRHARGQRRKGRLRLAGPVLLAWAMRQPPPLLQLPFIATKVK